MPEERPPRVSLVNLADESQFEFLVNPSTLKESIQAEYSRASALGLSHQPMQYKHTKNMRIPIRLYHSEAMQNRYLRPLPEALGGSRTPNTIMAKRSWLLSLLFPRSHSDFGHTDPPDVLFIWPSLYRLKGRVVGYSATHESFRNDNMRPDRFVATLNFESQLDQVRTMQEVQNDGTLWVGEEAV